jgi:hypothetical protein
LFIDYENVGSLCPPETIKKWVAWLEDGQFDGERRRRRLLEKRVYWNPSAQQHEEIFQAGGLTVILCEKHRALKNGADIRIALDVAKMTYERSKISDIVIPIRKFKAATTYVRPDVWAKRVENLKALFTGQRLKAWLRRKRQDPIELAVHAVVRVTSRNPGRDTPRKDIERELRKIRGFSKIGKKRYFGTGGYLRLMQKIASRSDKIALSNPRPHSVHKCVAGKLLGTQRASLAVVVAHQREGGSESPSIHRRHA